MMEEIKKLTAYQQIRIRTEMYFGSRNVHTQNVLLYDDTKPVLEEISWVPALYTALREIIDNCLDEVVGYGFGNKITIDYNPDTFEFIVEDNGRGIPIDKDEETKLPKATMVLSEIFAGRNFGDRGETIGLNGIGASGVNYCSEYFKVEIHRDKQLFKQSFAEGNPLFDDSLQMGRHKITKVTTDKSGTKISFKPSKIVFPTQVLPEKFVYSRIFEIAMCNPHIKIVYNGKNLSAKNKNLKNLFEDNAVIPIDFDQEGFKTRFLLVPDWLKDGDHYHGIVNNVPILNGGTHIDIFKKMFFNNLLTSMEKDSKKRNLQPNKSDITDGMLVFNVTNIKAPIFDSQSKTRLTNDEIVPFLKTSLENEELYKKIIKTNKEWIDEIYKRCSDRTMKKDMADLVKQNKKVLRTKVPALMDASGKDRSSCILLIAEGLSAISGMSSVRNPQVHGGLGLTGKILNVKGEHYKKVLDNSALSNIINSLGLVMNQKVVRSALRYGSLYIAHDMDPDGLNIGALLVNFLYEYWPELFDSRLNPFVYVFSTPFIIASKKSNEKIRKYWYSDNYHTFDSNEYNKSKGWEVTRAKGLGTLTEIDWEHSLKNPKLFPIVDDGKMKEALDLIFSKSRADDRKIWLGLN